MSCTDYYINKVQLILSLAVAPALLSFSVAFPPVLSEDQGSIEGLATPFTHVLIRHDCMMFD
ncbi:MAG: hypothetical protein HYU02_01400 [Thaumarchaeota archaeon]|nr:hypothetical protein [Nitrososphaerota archaeon]